MRLFSSLDRSRLRGLWAAWLVGLAVCLAVAVSQPGCSGCNKDKAKTEAEKEKERLAKQREAEKQPFDIVPPTSEPISYKELGCRYKPGHWTNAIIQTRSNKDDFVGELEISLLRDQAKNPVPLDAVPYQLINRRPIALSKGRAKGLHGLFYVPPTIDPVSGRMTLRSRTGLDALSLPFTMTRMLPHQYHFAVLARSPDRYAFLRSLDSVRPPRENMNSGKVDFHYWVALLKVGRQTPLPDDAMHWTSMAYVLWDDVDPKMLTPAQQCALVDWIHWGGQLIISGPDSLATLRGSFLDDFLPATENGSWALTPEVFDELNDWFTIQDMRPLAPVDQWSGVKLQITPESQYVPRTGKLLAERRVGRGRVVVSAMRLSDRSLIDWPGYDEFFNACLLRRPARKYFRGQYGDLILGWADRSDPDNPERNSTLRYFSRDAEARLSKNAKSKPTAATGGSNGTGAMVFDPSTGAAVTDPNGADPLAGSNQNTATASTTPSPTTPYTPPASSAASPPRYGPDGSLLPTESLDDMGVAAWRSFSDVANQARRALRMAACVELPGRWFVIWIIAAYLAVLVPLNWFIFAVMRRVEWAWAAAPMIAIVCTILVVHLARLDIGFARSQTTLGVIEIQDNYSRAHVASYTAMYTSLTTSYEFSDKEAGTLVQPFPSIGRRDDFRMLPGDSLRTLECHYGKGVQLDGMTVPSNSVDFVHAEQMVDLDGPFDILRGTGGKMTLVNRTGIPLEGVRVLRRDESGQLTTAWVGKLKRMGTVPLNFFESQEDDPDRRNLDPFTRENPKKGDLNLRPLIDMAEDTANLAPDEVRVVGWTKSPMGHLSISPSAPQARQAYVVLANIRHAHYAPPEPDANKKPKGPDNLEKPAIYGP